MINPFKFTILLLLILTSACRQVKKEYYDSGQLKLIAQVDGEGEWHGKTQLYKEDGSLDFESNYIHGQPDGVANFYYPNGNIRMIKFFENGIIDGEVQGFDATGCLNYTETHKNGKHLSYRWISKTGKEISGMNFLDIDNLPLLSEFNVKFSNNSDTFTIGDTVFIDIQHPSVFKNQIIPRTSNGTIIYHWDKDSFLYEFVPRNPGYTSIMISLRVNRELNENMGILKYKVNEK